MTVMETLGPLTLYVHFTWGQFCLFCNFQAIRNWNSMTHFTKVKQATSAANLQLVLQANIDSAGKGMLLTWSTTGQIIWGLTLEMAGRIALEATKVTKSWKQIKIKDKLEGKIFTKFRKSCRPVVFGQEGVFTIKRMTVLKFFRAIVKGTFRALLTIGE
ncbi:hypothetical protein Fcan01_10177 [Folsomia candida]|uniref:Uncharacterized protein n=1 Tax=Folsomia candida TaxID=158441 RepID=A0A226EBF9_FOLCA|nr:hypothetical protein Fcan01_10177 [Folsomia candida]